MKKQPAAGFFGRWTVLTDGTITGEYDSKTAKRDKILIYPDRLTEPQIILSLLADRINPEDLGHFMYAFELACRLTGITRTEIQTDFE